ncbi:MAG: hypothetical protein IPG89_10875 [Bacteroidetes bacterium]|nr:hypothetical protein [Bacteroidota bacterium]
MKSLLFIYLLFIINSTNLFGQKQSPKETIHSLDSCTKCCCKKYHREYSIDTLTQEKIVILIQEKAKHCKCNTSDQFIKYKKTTTQYFTTGEIHFIITEKGWYNGFAGDYKRVTQYYDKSGKKEKRISAKKIKALY